MRQTIVEKILSSHSGSKARVGDIIIANVDFSYGQDATSHMMIDYFKDNKMKDIKFRDRFCMVIDHFAPSPKIDVSGDHVKMRRFAKEFNVKLYDIGCGISHQIIAEKGIVASGDVVISTDGHAAILGALNLFSSTVGETDLALALTTGKCWFKVPETIKIVLDGDLPKGTYAKDVIMHVIGDIGKDNLAYKSVELYGDIISDLNMESRFTITGMATELGVKCAIMPYDKKTSMWLKKKSVKDPKPVAADEDARYAEIREYDMSGLAPQVTRPDSADDVCDIEDVEGTELDGVYIGSCSNGRFEDLEIASRILKGKKIAQGKKLIITPASKSVYLEALKKGLINIFVESGAIVNNPGCGPCVGTHQGVLADGEVVLSTANSNKRGIMGNPKADIYLGSPATAAASAIEGKIADPRKYKRRL